MQFLVDFGCFKIKEAEDKVAAEATAAAAVVLYIFGRSSRMHLSRQATLCIESQEILLPLIIS